VPAPLVQQRLPAGDGGGTATQAECGNAGPGKQGDNGRWQFFRGTY